MKQKVHWIFNWVVGLETLVEVIKLKKVFTFVGLLVSVVCEYGKVSGLPCSTAVWSTVRGEGKLGALNHLNYFAQVSSTIINP